jgi:hypothetical protein
VQDGLRELPVDRAGELEGDLVDRARDRRRDDHCERAFDVHVVRRQHDGRLRRRRLQPPPQLGHRRAGRRAVDEHRVAVRRDRAEDDHVAASEDGPT